MVSELALIRPASRTDAVALHSIRSDWELWLLERGVEQWGVGEVSIHDIATQISDGEWFVGIGPSGTLIGGMRYLTADHDVWPDAADGARYIHGLMVDRVLAAPGSGALSLSWAEARAIDEKVRTMRLDCVESNQRLRSFYRNQGYREIGRRDFDGPWFSATLFEKTLLAGR